MEGNEAAGSPCLLWKVLKVYRGLPGGSEVKNPPAMQETWVQSLCQKDLLEEGMVTHSSFLAGRIPWTEEPGRLHSIVWLLLIDLNLVLLFILFIYSFFFQKNSDIVDI